MLYLVIKICNKGNEVKKLSKHNTTSSTLMDQTELKGICTVVDNEVIHHTAVTGTCINFKAPLRGFHRHILFPVAGLYPLTPIASPHIPFASIYYPPNSLPPTACGDLCRSTISHSNKSPSWSAKSLADYIALWLRATR